MSGWLLSFLVTILPDKHSDNRIDIKTVKRAHNTADVNVLYTDHQSFGGNRSQTQSRNNTSTSTNCSPVVALLHEKDLQRLLETTCCTNQKLWKDTLNVVDINCVNSLITWFRVASDLDDCWWETSPVGLFLEKSEMLVQSKWDLSFKFLQWMSRVEIERHVHTAS